LTNVGTGETGAGVIATVVGTGCSAKRSHTVTLSRGTAAVNSEIQID
jgi:hypothetical protein